MDSSLAVNDASPEARAFRAELLLGLEDYDGAADEAGRALGVSRATVWRLIQRGELPSVRQAGRRLIPASALRSRRSRTRGPTVPAFTEDHPLLRMAGAARGGGRTPGARDKHAILNDE